MTIITWRAAGVKPGEPDGEGLGLLGADAAGRALRTSPVSMRLPLPPAGVAPAHPPETRAPRP